MKEDILNQWKLLYIERNEKELGYKNINNQNTTTNYILQ